MSWVNLTLRLKQDIIELLDYESRCHLRTCSKSDRETVDSTKPTAKMMKISEMPSEMAQGKTIIRMDIDTFTIWFIGREEVTRIDRGWNGEIIGEFSQIKQKNRYEVIGEFMERFSQKGFTKAETVEVESVTFPIPTTWNIKCNNLELSNITNDNYEGWLRRFLTICPKFRRLSIKCWGNAPEINLLITSTKVTDSLRVDHELEMSDEQLEMIEPMDLIVSLTGVTMEGLKKRLEKFLKYGKRGDLLEINAPWEEGFNAEEHLIPTGLILKKIKRNSEQEDELNCQIISGFENVHGIQNPRYLDCAIMWGSIRVHCKVYEEPTVFPCMLYPF